MFLGVDMLHRITLMPLLLMLPFVMPTRAVVASSGADRALRVDTVSRGIEVSLMMPHSVYPSGALTRATVRVRNLSGRIVTVLPGYTDRNCAVDNPQVQSLTFGGVVAYPPAMRAIDPGLVPPCTGGGSTPLSEVGRYAPLRPGAAVQVNSLIIVRGPTVRVLASVAPLVSGNLPGPAFTVVGRTTRLRLVQAAGPRIESCSARYDCLRVVPPAGARVASSLYYAYAVRCQDAKGTVAYAQVGRLEQTSGRVLHIGCGARPVELHVVAGWLDQPVATMNLLQGTSRSGAGVNRRNFLTAPRR